MPQPAPCVQPGAPVSEVGFRPQFTRWHWSPIQPQGICNAHLDQQGVCSLLCLVLRKQAARFTRERPYALAIAARRRGYVSTSSIQSCLLSRLASIAGAMRATVEGQAQGHCVQLSTLISAANNKLDADGKYLQCASENVCAPEFGWLHGPAIHCRCCTG